MSQDPVYLEDISRAAWGSILSDFLQGRKASKYTPLNQFLNDLIQESIPQEDERNTGQAIKPEKTQKESL